MATPHHATIPHWTWLAPLLAALALGAAYAGLLPPSPAATLIEAALLGAAVFAAVHHAELLALKLGEPFGSILLAVAVTVIEAALIVAILFGGGSDNAAVARDTIFSAVMIVLNGVIGLCLVLGGNRHFEQRFQLQGAASALAVLAALAALALILPNHTVTAPGPFFSAGQLAVVGLVSLGLWAMFVFVQTVRHRDYFLDAPDDPPDAPNDRPDNGVAAAALGLLTVSLGAVVLLAKTLSGPLESAVAAAGLPPTFVGVAVAAVVLLPEGLAAVRSALANRLQNAINLSLGSATASIGLTIPTVAAVSLWTGRPLLLGVTASDTVLLTLTLFVAGLTLGTGRTTVLQGAVHLAVFAAFLLLAAVP